MLDLKVGDKVSVINGYGNVLKGYTITEIENSPLSKDILYYIDWTCFWYPVTRDRLTLEKDNLVDELGLHVVDKILCKQKDFEGIYEYAPNHFVNIKTLKEARGSYDEDSSIGD